MINKIFILFLVIISVFIHNGCSDLEAPIPTYLVIDSTVLSTNQDEGSAHHDIRDVWVFDAGRLLGAYEIPTRIPLVGEGQKTIDVFAGIRANGNSFFPEIYNFYEPQEFNITLAPGDEIRRIYRTSYVDDANFAFIEDFEQNVLLDEDLDNSANTSIIASETNVFEGNRSGYVKLDTGQLLVTSTESYSSNFFNTGRIVFVELSYLTEVPLSIGVEGRNQFGDPLIFYKVQLLPNEDWRKTYVDFSDFFIENNIESARILVSCENRELLPYSETFIDNVKFMHF